jgi:serine/threonine protein kinase
MACLRDNFKNGVLLDGRYETISPLNQGSFGMVFTARDVFTNQTVAIKCLTKRATSEDSGFEFAIDEQSEEQYLHARLGQHPNIVNLIRSFETEAHMYLVMEFCERGDLYEAIRKGHGPLETEHVRQFMLQLLDAVAYSHNKGVYHRDIKPENIFLTQSGDLKLGDFGLATTENWTLENTVGSDRYMSPEQYDSAGAGYSPAQADIWAIGICLLNILFSRNPFTTPTEADPLFLDFSRDKQSLFDVFPDMSQDTYEVIAQCMSLDPRKRSLIGARAALLRVVSFTTSEEDMDDFCCDEKPVIATANREPLRTPSIQSPHIDQGAFPWTKALHATPPQPIRQLSAIPDESYSEDLFSKSGETGADWFSGSVEAPSVTSTIDSALGASLKSMVASRPIQPLSQIRRVSPMAGSLPITMSKPRNALSSIALNLRLNDVSKSWSDMWEEEEEEEEEQARQQLEKLQQMNSRTWSHDSKLADEEKTVMDESEVHGDIDGDMVADGFFFQDAPPRKSPAVLSPRYSPPPKRTNVDKWAALGEKRRAVGGRSVEPERSPLKPRRQQIGFGGFNHGVVVGDHLQQPFQTIPQNCAKPARERSQGCPWNKGRDWTWRRDNRGANLGDVEWVGGWQEAHV